MPITIYPPLTGTTLRGVEANALVDTGSTTTGITARPAATLGLASIGKRLVATVGGEKHVDRYIFRIGIGGTDPDADAPTFPCIFEEIVGFELLDSFTFGALIGMDILRQCELRVGPGDRCRLRVGA